MPLLDRSRNNAALPAAWLAAITLLSACGDTPAPPKPAAPAGKQPAASAEPHHHHEHRAPHHGCLVALGEEQAHLELVLDAKTGKLTGYVLDGEAEKPVRLKQAKVLLLVQASAKAGAASAPLTPPVHATLDAVADTLSGETAGDTSVFAAIVPALQGADRFEAILTTITVRGQEFRDVAFKFPEGNEEPAKTPESQATPKAPPAPAPK